MSRQLKVLLIKPPVEGFRANAVGSRHVPVGLLYLAHAVRKQCRAEVRVFDSLTFTGDNHILPSAALSAVGLRKQRENPLYRHVVHYGASWARLRAMIAEFAPDVVGITAMFSPFYRQAYATASLARELRPNALILLGGPHATVAWEHVFAHAPVDGVVLGEGETTFARLIAAIEANGRWAADELDPTHFPGLALRRADGSITVNHERALIDDLDGLGFPTPEEINFADYEGVTSLITSRGCPFSCTFCSVHAIVGKAFRRRSVESVLEELRYYARRGVRTFNIEDDNFTFDMGRVDELMEAICRADLGLELRFPNGITALKMTDERLRLFARAGVKMLFFGLESTDSRLRLELKKGFARLEDISALVQAARRMGIYAYTSLIVGLPQQTTHDIAGDIAEAYLRGLAAHANPYYPILGTALFAQSKGLIDEEDLEWHESMNFPVAGPGFTRGDVATAFVLCFTLTQPGYRLFHPQLLGLAGGPRPAEVLQALGKLGVLAAGADLEDLVVTPLKCFCEEQSLLGGDYRGWPDGHLEPCAFSGRLLQMLLELWTEQAYSVEESVCRLKGEGERCLFRLRATGQPLAGVVALFLERLRQARGDNRHAGLELARGDALSYYNDYFKATGLDGIQPAAGESR